MTKLTKAQLKERDDLCARLRDKHEELEAAVTKYNAAMVFPWSEVEAAVEAYNEAIQDAQAWKNDLAQEVRDYYDEKTEKWQESDKGGAVGAFADTLEEDLPEVELEQPEELEFDHEPTAEVLEQMPETADV